MKAFIKKYMGFIGNLLALGAMLGACFGAVVYIQDAPSRLIAAETVARQEADKALADGVKQQFDTLEQMNALRRTARDAQVGALDNKVNEKSAQLSKEITAVRADMDKGFQDILRALDRIESRVYAPKKHSLATPVIEDGEGG